MLLLQEYIFMLLFSIWYQLLNYLKKYNQKTQWMQKIHCKLR